MSVITNIHAREILDSRGNPTVQVEVYTELGAHGLANAPSGASTGMLEAYELRDKGTKYESNWYGGKGVQTAVDNVNNIIAKELIGTEVSKQREIDYTMIKLDGTKNKSKLGANAILAVSLAVAKAAADEMDIPFYRYIGGTNTRTMPVPFLNIINGGEHATNTLDFQEFMIVPIGASSFKNAIQMANKVYQTLKELLHKDGFQTTVGDEGGFAPNFKSHEQALDYMVEAIKKAGFKPAREGKDAVAIALDPATSEIYDGKNYIFGKLRDAIENKKPGFENLKDTKVVFSSDELLAYHGRLIEKYPIVSIEDGFAESDWEGFKKFNETHGDKIQIMGDDNVCTNPEIVKYAIESNSMNSVLIKLNQIGTLTESLETIELAHKANFTCQVSHRSGETDDTSIADLTVAMNTGQLKSGAVARVDRVSKYNRLLQIEEELGTAARFIGERIFHNLGKNVKGAKKPSLKGASKHASINEDIK